MSQQNLLVSLSCWYCIISIGRHFSVLDKPIYFLLIHLSNEIHQSLGEGSFKSFGLWVRFDILCLNLIEYCDDLRVSFFCVKGVR